MEQNKKRAPRKGAGPYSVIISADHDLEGWLRERQKLLTATDIPSILGVPGARSPLETWYQKQDALVARSEDKSIRQSKQAGHDFEDFNALMFAKASGRHVERSQQLLVSNQHTWLGATLDYTQMQSIGPADLGDMRPGKFTDACAALDKQLAGTPAWWTARPLELKNAGSFAADEMWPLGGEPHLTWQVQVTVQCIVMDAPWGSLSAWLGSPFVHHRWCDIERDKRVEEIILDEGEAFWKSLKRKQPPMERPEVAYEILRRLDPKHAKQKVISLPKEAHGLHVRIVEHEAKYEKCKALADDCKSELEAARAEMAVLIGEHHGGALPANVFGKQHVYTFKHVHVPAHTVAAHSHRRLQRTKVLKPKKTTWKTSNK